MAFADSVGVVSIRTAKELGRKGTYKYTWAACENCGKERWVAIKRGQNRNPLCHYCALQQNRQISVSGELNPNWRGGRTLTDGYVTLFVPRESLYYTMAEKNGRIKEHRLVMAKHLGRCLETWEIVHHFNRNRSDNRIENLELLPNASQHVALTRIQNYVKPLEERLAELTQRLSKYEGVN